MKRKIETHIVALMTLIALTAIIFVPVSGAAYLIKIVVIENNGSSYTKLPIITEINNTYLVSSGIISATGLDTRVVNAGNTALPHMVVDNKTLFVDNLTASSTSNFQYQSGYSALTSFPIIVGYGGNISTADNATIELGGNFTILIDGYVNTASGANKTILLKPDGANYAFKLWVSAAGNITAGIANGNVTALASNVTTGEHTVKVLASSGSMSIYVDDVLKQASALGTNTTPDTSDNYVWNQNNVMPYINSLRLYTQ